MLVPTPASLAAVVVGSSVALSALTGCASEEPTKVVLLVADEDRTSPRAVDVEAFEARVRQRCDECTVDVHDAAGDVEEQTAQAERAVAEGARVLVIEPVDATASAKIALDDVPLLSLATLIEGSDSFVGTDGGLEAGADAGGAATDDLEAARAVILGERRTVQYVPAAQMSEQAADVALGLLVDDPPPDAVDHDGVPSWLYAVDAVGLADLTSVLVGGGTMSLADLCSGETAKRCRALGLR